MASVSGRITRRAALEGIGVTALGLTGAALLGCGGGGDSSGGSAPAVKQSIEGATQGGGLPMTAPKAEGRQREGGAWTPISTATPKQHDPATALGTNIFHYVSEKGLEPDPVTGAIRPHVFSSWEVADPAGTTLLFKMSPNLFIHNKPPWNGRQFTAEDAAWNLERIGGLYAERLKIPKASFQRASMVANITKAEAIDALTVKVTLSKPNSAFFNGLMDTRVPFAPKEMDDIGWNDPLKMASMGPFYVTEWVNDQKITFKKWEQYAKFRPSEPHFDEINLTVVPDAAATQAAFISGQTQTYGAATPDLVQTVRRAKPEANLYTWVDSNWQHIRPSVTYAPFADFRVRRAIFLAIDYAAHGNGYYGDGWAYQSALCPGYPEAWKPDKVKSIFGFNPDTKQQARAEAKKLLEAAGFPNGKGIDLEMIFAASSEQYTANATRFQGQMGEVFPEMKVVLKPMPDTATFSVPQAEGKFKILAYNITSSPDAVIEMTSQYRTDGSRNYGKFSNADLDALMDKAAVELNRDARAKLLDEAQQRWIDEWMANFVLYAHAVKTFVQSNVGGYDTTAGLWFGYASSTKICRWFFVDK
jgi:ABC-type transport system substrate-binding protein